MDRESEQSIATEMGLTRRNLENATHEFLILLHRERLKSLMEQPRPANDHLIPKQALPGALITQGEP